jgi:hypothetical protein
MENMRLCLPFILALILSFSCVTTEPSVEPPQEITVQEVALIEEIVEVKVEEQVTTRREEFDPGVISQEYYVLTKEDVQHFIEELNSIIRNRNYNAWRNALSPEYFAQISSEENLQQISELPAMKTRGIVLRTPEDYFINVVVPSRANSRVDDIEFVNRDRVKAFTIMTSRAGEEQRLRLYDLERSGSMWKIIN